MNADHPFYRHFRESWNREAGVPSFAPSPPFSRWRRGTRGFTLLEVLVALAVIGLALGAIAGVFSTGLTGHETASTAETALAVAEEQLTLAAAAPHPGTGSGVYAERFAWRSTVAPYDDGDKAADVPSSLPRLYRIAVSVAWSDGHHGREVSLSTLRLGPAQ